ncbi:hypothetical protein LTR85_002046 [Meristemomyces frigidus]|nr:hypothetical protein LTR85_002046 [Meristemomyces frigidus]
MTQGKTPPHRAENFNVQATHAGLPAGNSAAIPLNPHSSQRPTPNVQGILNAIQTGHAATLKQDTQPTTSSSGRQSADSRFNVSMLHDFAGRAPPGIEASSQREVRPSVRFSLEQPLSGDQDAAMSEPDDAMFYRDMRSAATCPAAASSSVKSESPLSPAPFIASTQSQPRGPLAQPPAADHVAVKEEEDISGADRKDATGGAQQSAYQPLAVPPHTQYRPQTQYNPALLPNIQQQNPGRAPSQPLDRCVVFGKNCIPGVKDKVFTAAIAKASRSYGSKCIEKGKKGKTLVRLSSTDDVKRALKDRFLLGGKMHVPHSVGTGALHPGSHTVRAQIKAQSIVVKN